MFVKFQTPTMTIGWWLAAGVILTPVWAFIELRRGNIEKSRAIWRNSIPFVPLTMWLFLVSLVKYRTFGVLEASMFVFTTSLIAAGLIRIKASERDNNSFWTYIDRQIRFVIKRPENWIVLFVFIGAILIV